MKFRSFTEIFGEDTAQTIVNIFEIVYFSVVFSYVTVRSGEALHIRSVANTAYLPLFSDISACYPTLILVLMNAAIYLGIVLYVQSCAGNNSPYEARLYRKMAGWCNLYQLVRLVLLGIFYAWQAIFLVFYGGFHVFSKSIPDTIKAYYKHKHGLDMSVNEQIDKLLSDYDEYLNH